MKLVFSRRRLATFAGAAFLTLIIIDSISSEIRNNQPETPQFVLSVPGYESAVQSVAHLKHWDRLCGLDQGNRYVADIHGSWASTEIQPSCAFDGEDELFDSETVRGLTNAEVLEARNWYVSFLANEFFDSQILDNQDSKTAWFQTVGAAHIEPELLEKLQDNPGKLADIDGQLVRLDDFVLMGATDGVFSVVEHDGRSRLLGLALEGGSFSAGFYGLDRDQVEFKGYMKAFYRVNKAQLVAFELLSNPRWTLTALKEQHPEYFDASKLVLCIDAPVEHVLRKTGETWKVSRWGRSDVKYLIGG